jgi:hypothetical protein
MLKCKLYLAVCMVAQRLVSLIHHHTLHRHRWAGSTTQVVGENLRRQEKHSPVLPRFLPLCWIHAPWKIIQYNETVKHGHIWDKQQVSLFHSLQVSSFQGINSSEKICQGPVVEF